MNMNVLVLRIFSILMLLCLSVLSTTQAMAEEKFLAAEQAFPLQVRSISEQDIELSWKIAPQYYLYQHQFVVERQGQKVQFQLPPAQDKHDEFYGDTKVYHDAVSFQIKAQPNASYSVRWQGCAEKGLCYPISQQTFQTDATGLVSLEQGQGASPQPSLFGENSQQGGLLGQGVGQSADPEKLDQTSSDQANSALSNAKQPNIDVTDKANRTSSDVAEDEQWSARLHQQHFVWSVLLFLGLGCLLAFTPCSLPMLPILSSLLIRQHAGVRAGAISVVFVLAMASVYALLGVLAASAGSNLQRWLQQPAVLIVFAGVFVLFALNLFGVFELKLPQKWSQQLDQIQGRQKGGTLIGAAVMGMLSALLVGPCMTAPLAGTLLYISQTQNMLIGAVLLFSLGLGMGIPLIILSLIGQKALPKPGAWMHRIRHIFAWVMLGLALYFVRPLMSAQLFSFAMLLLTLLLGAYLLFLIIKSALKMRLVLGLMLVMTMGFGVLQAQHLYRLSNTSQITWHVVKTHAEFEQALTQAKKTGQPIIVDLYADWCIACQPIERDVWTDGQVQKALANVQRIKLDLSTYDDSHQTILKEWQMLGPPTVLFIQPNGQENRSLRLTGSFNQQQLLQHLQSGQTAQ